MPNLPDLSPLIPWYHENKRDLPWRSTKDPYRIWVSEIMLQQTRVETVIPYYHRFLEALPDVAALANAPEPLLLKLWEGLGYYSRARHMQKAAKSILAGERCEFPQDYAGIRALSGVGDYTAGAIASFAFDLPYPAVDGNVLRVAARLCAYETDVLSAKGKKELTEAVTAAQPASAAADFNQAMIELGALVCLPGGAADCGACPLSGVCAAKARQRVAELPVRRKAAPRKIEEKTVLILRYGDRVALRRRPENGLLAGLFEPFSLPGRLTQAAVDAGLDKLKIPHGRLTPLGEAKHIFTHLEWHMVGFEVLLDDITPGTGEEIALPDGCFFAPREEIDRRFAIPTAYRSYRPYI